MDRYDEVSVWSGGECVSGKGTRSEYCRCQSLTLARLMHECNLHPLMTSHYKHPHAKNKKAVCIGLVDGARIRHGGAKTLSSSSSSTASFIDLTCPVNRL